MDSFAATQFLWKVCLSSVREKAAMRGTEWHFSICVWLTHMLFALIQRISTLVKFLWVHKNSSKSSCSGIFLHREKPTPECSRPNLKERKPLWQLSTQTWGPIVRRIFYFSLPWYSFYPYFSSFLSFLFGKSHYQFLPCDYWFVLCQYTILVFWVLTYKSAVALWHQAIRHENFHVLNQYIG